jgi:regulator of cell morphogenesis and NO signaling
MENLETLTLGEIVKQDYRAAAVFEKYALDFCCMGTQNFSDACKTVNIEPSIVMNELQKLAHERNDSTDFDSWPLDLLVDYIYKRHHAYIEEKTPLLNQYLDKISRVHGARHPELLQLRDIFREIGGELTVHLKKEELMLFPYIKKLEHARNQDGAISKPLFSSVNDMVHMMKDDHSAEGEKFKTIVALTNNYAVPADGCNTYKVTYELLQEYEKDLHIHIHLENNILFPKAVQLDEQLNY